MHSTRYLTSAFLTRQGRVLLLYRRGSRVIADAWVGVGGHVEPHELTTPATAALRELHEEIGVEPDHLTDFALRYVATRDTGAELRTTYYFTAGLRPDARLPTECTEGDLRWFDLTLDPESLEMPPTARLVFMHWLATGRHDERLRLLTVDADGREAGLDR